MAGLSETKGIFPFELLTPEFLDLETLPSDPSAWVSRLTGKGPSQEEIDQALQLFKEKSFRNNADYLAYYLSLDTILLGKSVESLMAGTHEALGLWPVDVRRFTTSSLSSVASQLYLARRKRIALFSCNNTLIFSLLKAGTR